MNPLDARCNEERNDAICVSQLKNAKQIDEGILQEHPHVKIFLPFRFHLYTPEDLFAPNTYNRHLGKSNEPPRMKKIVEIPFVRHNPKPPDFSPKQHRSSPT